MNTLAELTPSMLDRIRHDLVGPSYIWAPIGSRAPTVRDTCRESV
jgi:hypothetical protein